MHLTNFAINKHHGSFEIDEGGEGGHKRSVSSLMEHLKEARYAYPLWPYSQWRYSLWRYSLWLYSIWLYSLWLYSLW